jgi:Lon protease-like protein
MPVPKSLTANDLVRLPLFPVPEATLFPGTEVPFHLFEPRHRALGRDVITGRGSMAIARIKPGFEANYAGHPPVLDLCGAGRVVDHVGYPDGTFDITLVGLTRVRILEELPTPTPYRVARVTELEDAPTEPALILALKRKLRMHWQLLAPHFPNVFCDPDALAGEGTEPGLYADRIAGAITYDPELTQALLSELDPSERLHRLAEYVQLLLEAVAPGSSQRASPLN